jgi:hypothetical protein
MEVEDESMIHPVAGYDVVNFCLYIREVGVLLGGF